MSNKPPPGRFSLRQLRTSHTLRKTATLQHPSTSRVHARSLLHNDGQRDPCCILQKHARFDRTQASRAILTWSRPPLLASGGEKDHQQLISLYCHVVVYLLYQIHYFEWSFQLFQCKQHSKNNSSLTVSRFSKTCSPIKLIFSCRPRSLFEKNKQLTSTICLEKFFFSNINCLSGSLQKHNKYEYSVFGKHFMKCWSRSLVKKKSKDAPSEEEG